MKFNLYCDGACSKNPGPGGWAFLILEGDLISENKILKGGFDEYTTNNRMEILSSIKGLTYLKDNLSISFVDEVSIFTDSEYLYLGITKWINSWLKNNWKNGSVKNVDLWLELKNLCDSVSFAISWFWVRGHSGVEGNEIVDKAAKMQILQNRVEQNQNSIISF